MKRTLSLLAGLAVIAGAMMVTAPPANAEFRITRAQLERHCTDPRILAPVGLTRAYGLVGEITNSRYGPHLQCRAYNQGRLVWYLPSLSRLCAYFAAGDGRYVRNARVGYVCLGNLGGRRIIRPWRGPGTFRR